MIPRRQFFSWLGAFLSAITCGLVRHSSARDQIKAADTSATDATEVMGGGFSKSTTPTSTTVQPTTITISLRNKRDPSARIKRTIAVKPRDQ
jgi:hypothetical protein